MKAAFVAGCFWGVQDKFDKLKGVKDTVVGYSGGTTKNPTYKNIGDHAESCLIEYDPKFISYEKLLEVFWSVHNPTHGNRQGVDIGAQYRSIIFYHNENQKKLAEESLKKEQKKYWRSIKTQIVKAGKFYNAEDYHQHYIKKTGKKVC